MLFRQVQKFHVYATVLLSLLKRFLGLIRGKKSTRSKHGDIFFLEVGPEESNEPFPVRPRNRGRHMAPIDNLPRLVVTGGNKSINPRCVRC